MFNKKTFYTLISLAVFGLCLTHIFSADVYAAPGNPSSAQFQNPISYSTVDAALIGVMNALQAIMGVLAVLMIVIGGVIYITSGGNSGQIDLAKKTVTAALIGLALALAAPALLREIYSILGGSVPSGTPAASRTLTQIITAALQFLLSILGTLSILMLVVGGVMYITSAGSDRAETGKKTIQYAIIGLIVSILALVIVKTVASIF